LVALYVTSLEAAAGKTIVCAGLSKHLQGDGRKVGFFKLAIADGEGLPVAGLDSDAVFMKHILPLEESLDALCPVISDHDNLENKIREAYAKVSSGKDVVIVEGMCEQSQTSYRIAAALDARVIIVEGYSKELLKGKNGDSYKEFAEHLLGVVLNKVPRSRVEHVRGEKVTRFEETGISVLGVLPEDRALFTLTIGELAEHLHGEILNCTERSAELVENFMLGAMCVDPGPAYFGRKANKAVVLRIERPDMQLAALETSTKCLILSGNTAPVPAVLYRAKAKNIPIILVKREPVDIVTGIEGALARVRFNQEKKLLGLTDIMESCFNFQAMYSELGLAN